MGYDNLAQEDVVHLRSTSKVNAHIVKENLLNFPLPTLQTRIGGHLDIHIHIGVIHVQSHMQTQIVCTSDVSCCSRGAPRSPAPPQTSTPMQLPAAIYL